MNKLTKLIAVGAAFAVQNLGVWADPTEAQKQQIDQARLAVRAAMETDEGRKAMCEEMLQHAKCSKMLRERMAKDLRRKFLPSL